ncbi:crossover junction endodeoxyribonuclease RuvC [bacterium]
MIILGIDPGIAITGWGTIKSEVNNSHVIDYNQICTKHGVSLSQRLYIIHKELKGVIKKYKPDCAAVEQLFFAKNVKTALAVGHARGVVLLTIQQAAIDFFEYTPLQIKQAVTGYGRADKQQMQKMVKCMLKLNEVPKPDDAADALAVALCHNQMKKWQQIKRAVTSQT